MSTLLVGRYVKIHSLASEKAKKHNGKTAIVRTPLNNETGRYGIQPNNEQVVLAIKPINFTILCSCCKMRDADESISCQRCGKESYCSNSCKKKHWDSDAAINNHEMWCIPVEPAMELPTRAIGEANVGDDAYEKVCQYLQLSMRIGNSGRRNEERAMLEALVKIDPLQPSAYNNLFVCCSELAALAERFRPEEYDELETKAIEYLIKGIEMLVDDEQLQDGVEENHKRSLEGPMQQVVDAYIRTINTRGLTFLESCMQGQRCMPGESHPKLERIEICLMAIIILFTQNETTSFKERQVLAYCQQKLGKYEEAVDTFQGVVNTTSTDDDGDGSEGKKRKSTAEYVDDKQWNHQSMLQIGQCLSSLAMYSNDKPAQERVDIIDKAVVKFNETIEQLKKDQGKTNCIPVFYAKYSLARCLYNASSLKTQLSRTGEISYNKEEMHTLFCETVIEAYQGALEEGDMDQAQEIKSLDNLPW